MPVMRRDKYSGGIVFDLTPEEKHIKNTRQELDALTTELQEKLKMVDAIIANNTPTQTE